MERLLPYYPLLTKDPYFSIWTKSEILTQSDTVFWHGETKPIYGTLEIDGETFGFLGKQSIAEMQQTELSVDSFSTHYRFECAKGSLILSFLSPLLPNDLQVLSCPVCYVRYKFVPKGAFSHASISLKLEERIAYNTCDDENKQRPVRAGVTAREGYRVGYIGRLRQMLLSHSSDEIGSDWGYYYLAGDNVCVDKGGKRTYLVATNDCGKNNSGSFLVAYDDICSVNYYGKMLKGYFFSGNRTILDALAFSKTNEERIVLACQNFDTALKKDAADYGENYYLILAASVRQCLAAHKLVKDERGRILFLSKECNSDGCVATVDITYPSAPLFLLYNPELLKGMLYPILDFARMDVWKYDFAPHDAGIYPYVYGQFYAVSNGNNKDLDLGMSSFAASENIPPYYLHSAQDEIYDMNRQMPLEECGNLIIMTAAVVKAACDTTFAQENYDLMYKWAQYLVRYGKMPDNQLCTDDFAGHLEKNCNLSFKAIVGIAAFAYLADECGQFEVALKMRKTAKEYAAFALENSRGKTLSKLVYDGGDDTFSLKYNLIFDKLFGFGLFDQSLLEQETSGYLKKMKPYGVPLDSRKDYTKSDWQMWVAALTDDKQKTRQFVDVIAKYLRETKSRVPFSDWYDSQTGEYIMFRGRSVHGGNFMLILRDKKILKLR